MMFFDRGYTGHEHLQSVGLINMNARLYDAKLHRFLQADSILQDPSNTQNYNKYGYCVNNPLRFTDPSGNEFVILGSLLLAAIVTGTAVSIAVYIGTNLYFGTPITAGGIIGAAVIGAISGAVTCGIGNAASSSFANFYSRAAFQALSHGAFQGTMTAIQGGNFFAGFLAGALSSIASSAWGGGKSYDVAGDKGVAVAGGFKGASHFLKLNNAAGTLFFGALAGGAGASLGGGNFWQGAVTGLVVSGLNHLGHHKDPIPKPKVFKLNLDIAKIWYNYAGGKPLHIDINSVDFSSVTSSDFDKNGYALVNLLGSEYSNLDDAVVHGRIYLQLVGKNSFKVANDPTIAGNPRGSMYDFNINLDKTLVYPHIALRNLLTVGAWYVNNFNINTGVYLGGKPYPIIYDGTYKMKK